IQKILEKQQAPKAEEPKKTEEPKKIEEDTSNEPKGKRPRKRIERTEFKSPPPATRPPHDFDMPERKQVEEDEMPEEMDEETDTIPDIDLSDLEEEIPDITDEDLGITEDEEEEDPVEKKRRDDYSRDIKRQFN